MLSLNSPASFSLIFFLFLEDTGTPTDILLWYEPWWQICLGFILLKNTQLQAKQLPLNTKKKVTLTSQASVFTGQF